VRNWILAAASWGLLASGAAYAAHDGAYEGTTYATSGKCYGQTGSVRVNVSETELVLTLANGAVGHLPIVWKGDSFSGQGARGPDGLSGDVANDRLTFDMTGTRCSRHFDLRRAS